MRSGVNCAVAVTWRRPELVAQLQLQVRGVDVEVEGDGASAEARVEWNDEREVGSVRVATLDVVTTTVLHS